MLSRSTSAVQTKLAVNRPGDAFEREADHVADRVMGMTAAPTLQRSYSSCKDENKVQRKCAECEEEEKKTELHRKETNARPGFAPPSVHAVLNSPGHPLDSGARVFMEPRFGQDFSAVRVHTNDRAAHSARAVNALAYTSGNNIVFDAAQYNPWSAAGRHLLAHELTHVVQQGSAKTAPALQRQNSVEREAALAGPDDPQADPVPLQDKPTVPSAPTPTPTPTKPACLPVITGPTWDVAAKPILGGSGQCDLNLMKAIVPTGSSFGLNGMEFKGTVSITSPCPGSVYFVQYAKPKRTAVACFESKEEGFCTDPGLGLDTSWPYPFGSVVNTDQDAGSTRPFNTLDSPGQKNISKPDLGFVRICIEDSFITYIVFEDKAKTLTSLGWMSWSYTAHAERDGGTCPLKTTSNDCAGWTITGAGKKDSSDFTVGASAPAQALDRSVKAVSLMPTDCAPTGCPKAAAVPAAPIKAPDK